MIMKRAYLFTIVAAMVSMLMCSCHGSAPSGSGTALSSELADIYQAMARGGGIKLIDIKALDAEGKRKLFFAIVEHRDRQLSNFRYIIEKKQYVVAHKDGAISLFSQKVFELRRKDNVIWMRGWQPISGTKQMRSITMRWDGSQGLSLSREPDETPKTGAISDTEHNMIVYTHYNEIIGLRMYRLDRPTMIDWLKKEHAEGADIQANVEQWDGREHFVGTIVIGNETTRIVLDPERGMMPAYMKVRYSAMRIDGSGENFSNKETWVTESREVDGLWVPMGIKREQFTNWANGVTTFEYKVEAFERNKLTDEDVALTFPPGTVVVDRIQKIAYRLCDDGHKEPVPLFDQKTGKVIDPKDGDTPDESGF